MIELGPLPLIPSPVGEEIEGEAPFIKSSRSPIYKIKQKSYGAMLIRVGNIAFKDMYKLQFDEASPPNPLPHRGGGISNLYLLRF